MKYWLFMFRPDTYAKVREHGIVGVRDGVRKSFEQIRAGASPPALWRSPPAAFRRSPSSVVT